jgi:hypothetical protein
MSEIREQSLAVTNNASVERGRRRSERVAPQIPIKLSARMPSGHRVCIEVKTEVVNAHGGLLDMGIPMEPGQRIMLNNHRGPELVTATILRIERNEDGRYLAAFEFEFPVTDFWPVAFPPDDLSGLGNRTGCS